MNIVPLKSVSKLVGKICCETQTPSYWIDELHSIILDKDQKIAELNDLSINLTNKLKN